MDHQISSFRMEVHRYLILTACLVLTAATTSSAFAGIDPDSPSHEVSRPDVWVVNGCLNSYNGTYYDCANPSYSREATALVYDIFGGRYGLVSYGSREFFFRALDADGNPISEEVSLTPQGDYPRFYSLNWTNHPNSYRPDGLALATYDDDYSPFYLGPYPQDVVIKTIYGDFEEYEFNLTGEDTGTTGGVHCGEAETYARTAYNPNNYLFLTVYTQNHTSTVSSGGYVACRGWNNPELHGRLHGLPPYPYPTSESPKNYGGNLGTAFANIYNPVTNEFVLGLGPLSLKIQRVNASGNLVGGPVPIPSPGGNAYNPELTLIPDSSGDMLLTWMSYTPVTDACGRSFNTQQVYAQRLNPYGQPVSPPVQVNDVNNGEWSKGYSAAALPDAILVTVAFH
ncbi:MAG: hypothetical protein HUJ31_10180, partial [Pseudomonadales bacterium]|nr:hypothetical protein [Pseudomonadales bacterium]